MEYNSKSVGVRINTEYLKLIQPALLRETRTVSNFIQNALNWYVKEHYPEIAEEAERRGLTP
jgi:hypothetical protein